MFCLAAPITKEQEKILKLKEIKNLYNQILRRADLTTEYSNSSQLASVG